MTSNRNDVRTNVHRIAMSAPIVLLLYYRECTTAINLNFSDVLYLIFCFYTFFLMSREIVQLIVPSKCIYRYIYHENSSCFIISLKRIELNLYIFESKITLMKCNFLSQKSLKLAINGTNYNKQK